MSKFIVLLVTSCALGVAHAAEIADAPIPADNIVGILVFLALMVGGGVWFAWKIMRNDKKSVDEKDKP
jgi:hypothetical protein